MVDREHIGKRCDISCIIAAYMEGGEALFLQHPEGACHQKAIEFIVHGSHSQLLYWQFDVLFGEGPILLEHGPHLCCILGVCCEHQRLQDLVLVSQFPALICRSASTLARTLEPRFV